LLVCANSPVLAQSIADLGVRNPGPEHQDVKVDLSAFDKLALEKYLPYLRRGAPVNVVFRPDGLSYKEKMGLVQQSSVGSILGDTRFEKSPINALLHGLMDRGESWTEAQLSEVLPITPVDCPVRRLLFGPCYDQFFAGHGENK
jgi:hypothetical protein